MAPLPARPNWNKALKDHSISFYQSKVRDLLCPYLCKEYNDPAYLDQDVKHVCDQLLHIAVSTLPICKRRKKKKLYVNNEELQASSKVAKEAWQKWCQAGRPRSGALFNERNIRRKETKRLADKCRARLDRLKWQKNEKNFKLKNPSRFRTWKAKPSFGSKLSVNSEIVTNPDEVLLCWADHFSHLFKSQSSHNPNVKEFNDQIPFLTAQSYLNSDDILDIPFTIEEIEFALKKLKKGKSGGIDGLQPEHLKYGGPCLSVWLKNILNASVRMELIPAAFLTGNIQPIFKGKGKNPLLCNSYRGITMMSVMMKVFEYAVLERFLPILHDARHPLLNQTAYQRNISCHDAIFSSQEAILAAIRDGGQPLLALYDLEKAYDSVGHPVLLKSLFDSGINGKSWRIIKACYERLQAVVSCGPSQSAPFSISRGVQQGSVLSPTFFLVIMDKLLHSLEKSNAGISVCNLYLGGAAHADDVRTISTSIKGASDQSNNYYLSILSGNLSNLKLFKDRNSQIFLRPTLLSCNY